MELEVNHRKLAIFLTLTKVILYRFLITDDGIFVRLIERSEPFMMFLIVMALFLFGIMALSGVILLILAIIRPKTRNTKFILPIVLLVISGIGIASMMSLFFITPKDGTVQEYEKTEKLTQNMTIDGNAAKVFVEVPKSAETPDFSKQADQIVQSVQKEHANVRKVIILWNREGSNQKIAKSTFHKEGQDFVLDHEWSE